MKISVDTSYLANYANEIEFVSSNLNQISLNIEKLILDVGFEWQGRSELIFTSKFFDVKKEYQLLIDFIKETSYFLSSLASEYENNENDIKDSLEV